jgi:hypothetical protein
VQLGSCSGGRQRDGELQVSATGELQWRQAADGGRCGSVAADGGSCGRGSEIAE